MNTQDKIARVAGVQSLLKTMAAFSAPPPLAVDTLPKVLSPDGVDLGAICSAGPAALGVASAKSATAIAEAVAALGMGAAEDDTANATIIWNETLQQIARIQQLYKLPAFPFQSVPLPSAPSPTLVEP